MQARIRFLWIVVGAVGMSVVRAESPRAARSDELSIRWASITPLAGFEKVSFGGDSLYVSPRPVIVEHEILAVEPLAGRSGAIDLTLAPEAAARVGRIETRQIAVFLDRQPSSMGTLRVGADGRASVAGVLDLTAQRVLRVFKGQAPRTSEPANHPVVTLMPGGRSGDLYFVDAYVHGAPDLRTYQVAVAASGGSSGELILDEVQIDAQREDYVFFSLDAIAAEDQLGGRAAGVLKDGGIDATDSAYLGTFVFRASANAQGTFDVQVDLGEKTFLADSTNEKTETVAAVGVDLPVNRGRTRDTGR
jgi:hypothetical protein